MSKINLRMIGSVLLIGFGVLLLLNNLNIIPLQFDVWDWIWGSLFGLAGLAFGLTFLSNPHDNWWAAIPGFTLLGLAGLTSLPFLQGDLGGGFFLGMIGLSFWVIYFIRREFWWAIIPGGVLMTLALVASGSRIFSDMATGGIFFLGLALTFLVVYLMPMSTGHNRWAIWPAGILGTMALLLIAGQSDLARYIGPAALILVGGLLVLRSFKPRLQ